MTNETIAIVLIGCGATALLDAWLMLLRRLGVPTLGMALLGRWAGHLLRGRLRHASIGKARPLRHEAAVGWAVHYAIGIGFAALLVALAGVRWLHAPTLPPALVFGLATVVAPLFVMQPAMGAGFAASKTPAPLPNCLRSVANHLLFGCALYLCARLVAHL